MTTSHKDLCTCMTLATYFLQWVTFLTSVVKKISTHILCSKTSSENCVVYKMCIYIYGTARQAIDDNMMQHMCFACYRHTPKIWNSYCFCEGASLVLYRDIACLTWFQMEHRTVLLRFLLIMQTFAFALPKISVCVCVCAYVWVCVHVRVGGRAAEWATVRAISKLTGSGKW